jgi:two-component system sensor histidine kinase KdpD
MARTVIEEADHLNQIVGNLLELARMRAGALIPARQVIFLEDVVASALRRMRRLLDGFEVRTDIRPQLPPIEADPVQIEQVLTNLLENAMRFSPRGSEITISVAGWRGAIRAHVTDRGPGISEENVDKVFDEFFSRDAGEGRGGTGLGLAIAKAVVVAHGGRIWAQRGPGGGATIAFELPAASEPIGNGAVDEGALSS